MKGKYLFVENFFMKGKYLFVENFLHEAKTFACRKLACRRKTSLTKKNFLDGEKVFSYEKLH